MIELDQTIFVGDDSGVPGNCLQAAVASLLDLPLADVPHFVLWEDWLERMVEFAAVHGRVVRYRTPDTHIRSGLAAGMSPRGVRHAVVVVDGAMVWDPHPSRSGLTDVSELYEFVEAS